MRGSRTQASPRTPSSGACCSSAPSWRPNCVRRGASPFRFLSGTSGRGAGGHLEPNAGAGRAGGDAPALSNLVDQEESPATGGVAGLRRRRLLEVGARVDHLDTDQAVAPPALQPDGVIRRGASMADRVGDQLRDQQREIVLHRYRERRVARGDRATGVAAGVDAAIEDKSETLAHRRATTARGSSALIQRLRRSRYAAGSPPARSSASDNASSARSISPARAYSSAWSKVVSIKSS